MWIIEDKGSVFARASIMAIIDSEPYDLYHQQLLLATILQNVKNKLMIFVVGNQLIYFR